MSEYWALKIGLKKGKGNGITVSPQDEHSLIVLNFEWFEKWNVNDMSL